MKYHYTDKELKALLSSMTIIIDTREQKNSHIVDYLDKHKVAHTSKKLDYGDYSCMIPVNPELGIVRDTYFTDVVAVERKNGLTELSNNLSNDRDRFVSELLRTKGTKLFLMIENTLGGYDDILNHKYNSKYNEKSFIATLKSFEAQFNINISFLPDKELSGFFIFSTLYYTVRNYLLGR
jgi:ERCC4-type nuclease